MVRAVCRESKTLHSQAHSSQVTELTNSPDTADDKVVIIPPLTDEAVVSAESIKVQKRKVVVVTFVHTRSCVM